MRTIGPFSVAILLLAMACSPRDVNKDVFNRRALLEHYATLFIIPAYDTLLVEVTALSAAADALTDQPNPANLVIAREAWSAAYAAWQQAHAFNFGPAGEQGTRKSLLEEIGTFPVNTTIVESRIQFGQLGLADFQRDARGFLAAEYLLYGHADPATAILAGFQAQPNRGQYLRNLSDDLKTRVESVRNAWSNYYPDFISRDGTDVGSSTALLYNAFLQSYEALKNFKIGLPLGKRPGQVQPEPTLVEARFSGQSLAMIKEHLASIFRIWQGKTATGVDGPGFRNYLQQVEGGDMLIAQTEAQMAATLLALNDIPDEPTLAILMASEDPRVVRFDGELQKLTRFLKSDMSSLLGISITFASGDGD
jgi:predicted lipoprotein